MIGIRRHALMIEFLLIKVLAERMSNYFRDGAIAVSGIQYRFSDRELLGLVSQAVG